MERLNFRIVLGNSPETMRKLYLSTEIPYQEFGEITIFDVVFDLVYFTACSVDNFCLDNFEVVIKSFSFELL